MTPPTPDLTALEQWARQELEYLTAPDIKGDPDSIASLQSALALCETVRAQQAELTKWQTCSGCGETMDAPGHCSNAETEWSKAQMEVAEQALNARDAAVARAEQAERERDALMVQVDQWRRMADREVTACVEMRSDRDAARAEVAQLQQAIKVQANAVRVIDQKERAEYVATKTLDSERAANERLTDEVERLQAEVAQARVEREEARTALDGWVKWASTSRCIYCGQEFTHDPHDQEAADEPKKAHILVCESHPLRQAKAENATLRAELQAAQATAREWTAAVMEHHPVTWAMDPTSPRLMVSNIVRAAREQAHPTPAQEGQ